MKDSGLKRISYKDKITFYMYHYNGYFLWISLKIDKRMREKKISKEIVMFLLNNYKGMHIINFFDFLTSFKELSKELKWNRNNDFALFVDCHSYLAPSIKTKSFLNDILKEVLTEKNARWSKEVMSSKNDYLFVVNKFKKLVRQNKDIL